MCDRRVERGGRRGQLNRERSGGGGFRGYEETEMRDYDDGRMRQENDAQYTTAGFRDTYSYGPLSNLQVQRNQEDRTDNGCLILRNDDSQYARYNDAYSYGPPSNLQVQRNQEDRTDNGCMRQRNDSQNARYNDAFSYGPPSNLQVQRNQEDRTDNGCMRQRNDSQNARYSDAYYCGPPSNLQVQRNQEDRTDNGCMRQRNDSQNARYNDAYSYGPPSNLQVQRNQEDRTDNGCMRQRNDSQNARYSDAYYCGPPTNHEVQRSQGNNHCTYSGSSNFDDYAANRRPSESDEDQFVQTQYQGHRVQQPHYDRDMVAVSSQQQPRDEPLLRNKSAHGSRYNPNPNIVAGHWFDHKRRPEGFGSGQKRHYDNYNDGSHREAENPRNHIDSGNSANTGGEEPVQYYNSAVFGNVEENHGQVHHQQRGDFTLELDSDQEGQEYIEEAEKRRQPKFQGSSEGLPSERQAYWCPRERSIDGHLEMERQRFSNMLPLVDPPVYHNDYPQLTPAREFFEVAGAPSVHVVYKLGYGKLKNIQAYAGPCIRDGWNVSIESMPGTGKTMAYLLPLIKNILEKWNKDNLQSNSPTVLIVTPSVELAKQVAETAYLASHGVVSTGMEVGLLSYKSMFFNRDAKILVGTPVRLKNSLDKGNISLESTRAIVIEEADWFFSYGLSALKDIFEQSPDSQKIIVGSTASGSGYFTELTKDKRFITFFNETRLPMVNHRFLRFNDRTLLKKVLQEVKNPNGEYIRCIVVCANTEFFKKVRDFFRQQAPYDAGFFITTKDENKVKMTLEERERVLEAFIHEQFNVLVTMDGSLTHGIRMPNIKKVVQVGCPDERNYPFNVFVHRLSSVAFVADAESTLMFDITKKDSECFQLIHDLNKNLDTPDWMLRVEKYWRWAGEDILEANKETSEAPRDAPVPEVAAVPEVENVEEKTNNVQPGPSTIPRVPLFTNPDFDLMIEKCILMNAPRNGDDLPSLSTVMMHNNDGYCFGKVVNTRAFLEKRQKRPLQISSDEPHSVCTTESMEPTTSSSGAIVEQNPNQIETENTEPALPPMQTPTSTPVTTPDEEQTPLISPVKNAKETSEAIKDALETKPDENMESLNDSAAVPDHCESAADGKEDSTCEAVSAESADAAAESANTDLPSAPAEEADSTSDAEKVASAVEPSDSAEHQSNELMVESPSPSSPSEQMESQSCSTADSEGLRSTDSFENIGYSDLE